MIAVQNRMSQYQIRESNRVRLTDQITKTKQERDNSTHAKKAKAARLKKFAAIEELIRTSEGPVTSADVSKLLGIHINRVSDYVRLFPDEVTFKYGDYIGGGVPRYRQLVLKGAK